MRARRRFFGAVVALLITAGVSAFVATRQPEIWKTLVSARVERPELRDLFSALSRQASRPIDGRLAGGFPYAPPPVQTRGARGDIASPDVRIAAAMIEKRARTESTPPNHAALGAAYLALGEWGRAVESMDEAVEAEPRNVTFLNDAAAAYLARAASLDQPEDYVRALDAAARAIRIDPKRPEPHFNRALALRALHLTSEAQEALTSYSSIDRTGPWTTESARRLNEIRDQMRRTSTSSLDNQRLRERIEDEVLSKWGKAFEQGDEPGASRLLAEAESLTRQLVEAGGDAMARDEVALIRRVKERPDRSALRNLAAGHRLFGEARADYVQDRQVDAADVMERAAIHFRAAGSPYWQWSPVFRAISLRNKGDNAGALKLLRATLHTIPREYFYLRGRLAWIQALLRSNSLVTSRDLFSDAITAFSTARESDNLIATRTILAEVEWFLGDRANAWKTLQGVFAEIERRGVSSRTVHFELAATMALDDGVVEAALEFQDAEIRTGARPTVLAATHVRRARALARLGERSAALEDLAEASNALAGISDPILRERYTVDADVVRAELYGETDCRRAMTHVDAALPYLTRTGRIWLGRVLEVKARCREMAGDIDGARRDLLEAVEVFEGRRAALPSAERALAFELERATFKDLLALEVLRRGDEAAGLRVAERARRGNVSEAWTEAPGDPADHRALGPDVAVIYYESLADRVLIWVLTRERRVLMSQPIGEAALRRDVERIGRTIQQGADLTALRHVSASFVDALVARPLEIASESGAHPKARIVFVPDGPLFGLPFGALPDAQQRPLLETHAVSIAPSLTTLFAASTRLASFVPTSVLAVGDGHDAAMSGLPRLPRADDEAAEVARMYPRGIVLAGVDATKRRFFDQQARVIHFAGHSVLNERYAMFSRLLFAPEPGRDESGWLLASEITPVRFRGTDVVVLATCEGAAGRTVEGEGAISLTRAFFAAGIPAVVGSLWQVDDDVQTFARTFHRTLIEKGDVAQAVAMGQRALLAERGRRSPVRVWGGFIMMGGLAPAS
jgi:CHAT domain-containing protein